MLTKKQKKEIIEEEIIDLKKNKAIVFIDFTGVKTSELNSFRKTVRQGGGELKVVKKKLLRIAMKESGMDFSPEVFESQAGAVFSENEMFNIAQFAHKFSSAKILGGYDIAEKKFVSAKEVIALGQLPSKEVLLGQLAYVMSSPIKSLMFVLKEKALKVV